MCDSAIPRTEARQGFLSFTVSQSLFKLMSIEFVMPSNHLNLNLTQHLGLFQWVSSLPQVAKVLELQLQLQYFQWKYYAMGKKSITRDHMLYDSVYKEKSQTGKSIETEGRLVIV